MSSSFAPRWFAIFLLLAAVNAQAGLDSVFAEKIALNGNVKDAVELPNGQLIIGGDFESVNGVSQRFAARLNADGTLDGSWRPVIPGPLHRVTRAGNDIYFLGEDTTFLRRASLQGDGTLDAEWTPDTGAFQATKFVERGRNLTFAAAGEFIYVVTQKAQATAPFSFDQNPVKSNFVLARYLRAGSGALDTAWKPKILRTAFGIHVRLLADAANMYVAHQEWESAALKLERFSQRGSGVRDPRWALTVKDPAGFDFQNCTLRQDAAFIYLANSSMSIGSVRNAELLRFSKATGKVDARWKPAVTAIGDFQIAGSVLTAVAFREGGFRFQKIPLDATNAAGGLSVDEEYPGVTAPVLIAGAEHAYLLARKYVIEQLQRVTKVRAQDGLPIASYRPEVLRNPRINAMERLESGVTYVGGIFDRVGNFPASNLARFDAAGMLDIAWTPNPQRYGETFGVETIRVVGDKVYAQGGIYYADGRGTTVIRFEAGGSGRPDTAWDAVTPVIEFDPFMIREAEFGEDAAFLLVADDFFSSSGPGRIYRVPYAGNGTPDPAWNSGALGNVDACQMKLHQGFLYVSDRAGTRRYATDGGGAKDAAWSNSTATASSAVLHADAAYLYIADAGKVRRLALEGSGADDATWNVTYRSTAGGPPSLLRAGAWLYLAGGFDRVNGQSKVNLARVDAAGVLDAGLTLSVPVRERLISGFYRPQISRWVAAAGPSPILGGEFEEANGSLVSPPLVFVDLVAPALVRSDRRVFAVLEGADRLAVTQLRVTSLVGGTLATSEGRPVAAGELVSLAEAREGLDFTPEPAFEGARSLSLAAVRGLTAEETGPAATIDLTGTLAPRNRYTMAAATIRVREGAAQTLITVQKTGAEAGTVHFAVQEGIARFGQHITAPASTVLEFPAGDGAGVIAIPLLDDAEFTGNKDFRVVLTGSGEGGIILPPTATNVTIEDDDPLGNTESLTVRPPLSAPPVATSSLRVELNAPLGAWRLLGETGWHSGGETLAELTAGNYVVEFRQANGFIAPAARTEPVPMGAAAQIAAAYLPLEVSRIGALSVTIAPPLVANAEGDARGQWRIVGETIWRDSDSTFGGLAAGPYEVEFKPVSGSVTPANEIVLVGGVNIDSIVGTYLIEEESPGAGPEPLDFAEVQQEPYGFVGQVQTALGFASGTAVQTRVVLTVAHALFDDETLSVVPEARWLHQKARGTYESPARTARGWYAFEGYASQRKSDLEQEPGSIGLSTAESQKLDVAALYFLTPAARGAFAGYLRTGPGQEWLLSDSAKMLAGYPVARIPETGRGIMHATSPAVDVVMRKLNPAVYATDSISGAPGMSGGPLFVEKDGEFFPAAVFLGGSAQTIMRVIDAQVVDLINRAEISGNGGENNVGGGSTQVVSGVTTSAYSPTLVGCTITPPAAVAKGAAWRLVGDAAFRATGEKFACRTGTYRIEFKPVDGFETPPAATFDLVSRQTVTVLANYRPAARITSAVSPAGSGEAPTADFAIGETVVIRARPNPNFMFEAWMEGEEVIGRNEKLSFKVTGPRQLKAIFVKGSFDPYAGRYSGFRTTGEARDGFADLTMTSTGSFTGTVTFGGVTYRVKGAFDAKGEYTGPLGKTTVTLKLDRSSPTGVISSIISAGPPVVQFTATQSPFDAEESTVAAGVYTLLLPPQDAAESSKPQGHGFATVKVDRTGGIRFTGRLADGVAIQGASQLQEDGSWALYAPIAKGAGALTGMLHLRETAGVSDGDGALQWIRPAGMPDKLYPDGFGSSLPAAISRYAPPALDITAGRLQITAVDAASSFSREVKFSAKGIGTSVQDRSLRITFQAATGLFTGTATPPGSGRKLTLGGAVFQKTGAVKGYYQRKTPAAVGALELTPNP